MNSNIFPEDSSVSHAGADPYTTISDETAVGNVSNSGIVRRPAFSKPVIPAPRFTPGE